MVELPAVNTPQFDWARNRCRQPRPVPPIVQPEVIAEAIFRAALHPQREYWIGLSTMKAILANGDAGVLDRYLAANTSTRRRQGAGIGVTAGQSDGPGQGLHRTRGNFGEEAAERGIRYTARWRGWRHLSARLRFGGFVWWV